MKGTIHKYNESFSGGLIFGETMLIRWKGKIQKNPINKLQLKIFSVIIHLTYSNYEIGVS